MFQYKTTHMNFVTCVEDDFFMRHKSFWGGIEDITDEPHSDRAFEIKWHNMTELTVDDWLIKVTVRFVEQ